MPIGLRRFGLSFFRRWGIQGLGLTGLGVYSVGIWGYVWGGWYRRAC